MIPVERVVERAVEWCQNLLRLPQQAMTTTRHRARADVASFFDQGIDRELDDVINAWWSEETQTVLRAVAAKLTKKRSG